MNLQNIPAKNKEIRKIFTASDGYKLISCDYSQQEVRILAHCSGDERLIQVYKENKDVYASMASLIYGVPYEECLESHSKEAAKRRSATKTIVLGILYGRGPNAVAEDLNISVKEARQIIDKFYSEFSTIRNLMDSALDLARDNGYTTTVWGRHRNLPELIDGRYLFFGEVRYDGFDPLNFTSSQQFVEINKSIKEHFASRINKTKYKSEVQAILDEANMKGLKWKDNTNKVSHAERQAFNAIIQGTAADMVKLAMVNLSKNERFNEMGAHILLQVHDELIVECPEEFAQECSDLVSKIMIDTAAEKISVPMKCDAVITKLWYEDE